MSKEEMIQEIIEISAHNMDWFIGIVGLLLAFFTYFQWKLSQSQLDKLKKRWRTRLRLNIIWRKSTKLIRWIIR